MFNAMLCTGVAGRGLLVVMVSDAENGAAIKGWNPFPSSRQQPSSYDQPSSVPVDLPRARTHDGRATRTSIKPLLQFQHFAVRTADAVDALGGETVLLHRLAALVQERRYINVVAGHLFGEVHAEGWSALVGQRRMGWAG